MYIARFQTIQCKRHFIKNKKGLQLTFTFHYIFPYSDFSLIFKFTENYNTISASYIVYLILIQGYEGLWSFFIWFQTENSGIGKERKAKTSVKYFRLFWINNGEPMTSFQFYTFYLPPLLASLWSTVRNYTGAQNDPKVSP